MLAVVGGFVVAAGVIVVRSCLLDDSTYTSALATTNTYERVYTDVLADPELSDVKERLVGGLQLGNVDPQSVRILTTNALRWAVPPSTIQHGTESFIAAVLAYLRGDTARLDGDVDVRAAVDAVRSTAVEFTRSALAPAGDRVAGTIAEYRTALASFAADLRHGRLPDIVPTASPALADSEVARAIVDALGPRVDTATRTLVQAGVAAGNERDALVTSMAPDVEASAAAAVSRLRAALEGGHDFDPVAAVAEHAHETTRNVVAQLNTVRDVAAWFDVVTLVIALVCSVAGLCALGYLNRRSARRAVAAISGALLLAGLTTLALWLIVRHVVQPPLHAATATGPGTWDLPAGVRGVVGAVEANLAGQLDDAVRAVAFVPIAIGGALALGLAVAAAARRLGARQIATVIVAGAATAIAVTLVLTSTPSSVRACNGHVELCDRRYDEVVQAATHNSMSSPDVVQVWPEQDGTIREQLDAGVRVLLIDTHYWTAIVSADQLAGIDRTVPADVVKRTLDAGGDRLRAHEGVFLCHNHCVWGGEPLRDGLAQVRDFLDDNPDDVVTLVVEDETSVDDTVRVFAEAGLDRFVYTHDPGDEWPMLGRLIDTSQRLVVFAENHGPPPDWYRSAFVDMQDTPYGFPSPAAMSCAPNRGPNNAPLFLMNHWVTTVAPDRRTAAEVNTRAFIEERAEQCARERRHTVNFVAVDFSNIGDVVGAVDALNGVG